MKALKYLYILCVGLMLTFIPKSHAQGIEIESDALTDIMQQFERFDINGDGTAEINSLLPALTNGFVPVNPYDPLLLVIIEDRLLEGMHCSGGQCFSLPDLMPSLTEYRDDLLADGYAPRLVVADVYDGAVHQDGRTVLAMRQFLQHVQYQYPNLQGAVLVGSFPESLIVRSYAWKKHDNGNIDIGGKTFSNTDYIRIWPEIVAMRSDIVLSDLDGNWENVYQQQATTLPSLMAVVKSNYPGAPKCPEQGSLCVIDSAYEENDEKRKFEDFFYVNDSKFVTFPWTGTGTMEQYLYIFDSRNDEVGAQDNLEPNPIAYPEIMVSRINARHIAVDPDPTYTGLYGKSLLDPSGVPQTITTYGPHWHRFYLYRNPLLERELLVQYFQRNREYRMGMGITRKVTGVGHSFDPTYHANEFTKAIYATQNPVIKKNATLLDFAQWIKEPALVKVIEAHANAGGSFFGSQFNVATLDAEVGGSPFQWTWVKDKPTDYYRSLLVPSLEREGGRAALPLYRSLWNNGILAGQGGSFFVNSGCDANSPAWADKYPYSAQNLTPQKHISYGDFQNNESILFYANGLAVIGRAKVFNDFPRDVVTPLQSNGGFGEVVRTYYEKDRIDGALDSVAHGIKRKRTYFWSIIGDWTLRLN